MIAFAAIRKSDTNAREPFLIASDESVSGPPECAIVVGFTPSSSTLQALGANPAFDVQLPAQRMVGASPTASVPENVTLPATSRVPPPSAASCPPWNSAFPETDTVWVPCATWKTPEVRVRLPFTVRLLATAAETPEVLAIWMLGSAAVDEIAAWELPSNTIVPVATSDPVIVKLSPNVGVPAPRFSVPPGVTETGPFAWNGCEATFSDPSIGRIQFTVNGATAVTLALAVIPSWSKGAAAERVCGDVPLRKTWEPDGAKLASLVQFPPQRMTGRTPVAEVPENVTSPATSMIEKATLESVPPWKSADPLTVMSPETAVCRFPEETVSQPRLSVLVIWAVPFGFLAISSPPIVPYPLTCPVMEYPGVWSTSRMRPLPYTTPSTTTFWRTSSVPPRSSPAPPATMRSAQAALPTFEVDAVYGVKPGIVTELYRFGTPWVQLAGLDQSELTAPVQAVGVPPGGDSGAVRSRRQRMKCMESGPFLVPAREHRGRLENDAPSLRAEPGKAALTEEKQKMWRFRVLSVDRDHTRCPK